MRNRQLLFVFLLIVIYYFTVRNFDPKIQAQKICYKYKEKSVSSEVIRFSSGGQSNIYSCNNDKIIKIYRQPWRIRIKTLTIIYDGLNIFEFVPKTFFSIPHGFIQEKINGNSKSQLTADQHYSFGEKLAKIHSLELDLPDHEGSPCVSNTNRMWDHMHLTVSKWLWNGCFMDYTVPTSDYLDNVLNVLKMTKTEFDKEINLIESFIKSKYIPNSFCHNDLHYKNIISNSTHIKIIDFDHADYGYRGYDFGYYFIHSFQSELLSTFFGKSFKKGNSIFEIISGYCSIAENESSTCMNDLKQEISHFLPYVILDHLLSKKPKIISKLALLYKEIRHRIQYDKV